MNGDLREGKVSISARVIDEAVAKSTLSKPVQVRRFIGKSMGASGVDGDYAKVKRQLDSGSYRDDGFMSTEHVTPGNTVGQMARLWSESGKAAASDIVLEMDLPKGFKALDLQLNSLNDNHLSEVLLPRGVAWDVVGKSTVDGVTVYRLRPKRGK